MAKPGPPPESLLAALPPELSRGLFAEAPKISLATDQTLFFAGDEGDGCYRLDEGMLICKDRSSTGLSTDSRAPVSCFGFAVGTALWRNKGRTKLCTKDPAHLWQFYIQLVEIEAAFKNLKDDLGLRLIYHQLEQRIEAHSRCP